MFSYKFSLTFALLFIFFTHIPTCKTSAQTQALRIGNVVQYFLELNEAEILRTTGTVWLNGRQYFERKSSQPWFYPKKNYTTYERISGDSAYYILTPGNTDSLIFNFNWTSGTLLQSDTAGIYISERRIDSINIEQYLLPADTIFHISQYTINTSTGDTSYWFPPAVSYSKKLGEIEVGLWKVLQGAKIDGIRYGTVYPYPEEVYFSPDSLYRASLLDTLDFYLVNSSDYDIIVDTLKDNNYYGYLTFFIHGNDYFFINFAGIYPNHPLDTLRYPVAAHDSVHVRIYDIDLCPLCRETVQPRYFTDSINFVSHFKGSSITTNYSFKKMIPVTGYAIGDVENNGFIPDGIILYQNYPNPFNPATNVIFSLNKRVFVQLKVYDILGREVSEMVNEERIAGRYNEIFTGTGLPSGVYLYKLTAGDYSKTRKFLLLK